MDHKTASFTELTFPCVLNNQERVYGLGTKAFTHTGGLKALMSLPGVINLKQGQTGPAFLFHFKCIWKSRE